MSKNPLTFKHISDGVPLPATAADLAARQRARPNSEVHNTGEVWASMLWECYSNLLNDTGRLTFAQAQDRMKRYLVAGFKMTPIDPTFVQRARRAARRDAGAGRAGPRPVPRRLRQARARRRRGGAEQPVGRQRRRRRELPHDGGRGRQGARDRVLPRGLRSLLRHATIPDEITKLDNGTLVGLGAHRRVVQRLRRRAGGSSHRVPLLQHGVRRRRARTSTRPTRANARR